MRIKLMALSAICLLLSVYVSAQVNWVGSGDGISWNDAANWSSGAVPAPGDDVIIDNSIVAGNFDVTLPTDATIVSVNSITITPASPAIIRLLIPASNTAGPAIHVTATGNAFVLNTGASFINASSGNIVIDGNFILNGTSSADLSSGTGNSLVTIKGNFSVGAANSITESGTGNPIIELNGNSNQTISSVANAFTGNNLDFIVNTTGTVTLLTNVFLPHNLTVEANSILDIANAAISNVLGIKGDLVVKGIITESGTATPRVTLNGTINQNITVFPSGSITGDHLVLRLNNPAGATLLSDLVLPYWYTIQAGNLTLGNFSLTTTFVDQQILDVVNNHIITNGTGFLIIPNVGAAVVTFPIGIDGSSLNQVQIQDGSGLTYSVRVEPGVTPTITMPFNAIDRTWIINNNSAIGNPAPANVTFYYYTGQGRSGFNYASTVDIGQYIPSAWNIVQNGLSPTNNLNEYRAFAPINSFNSPFIIGNHGAILALDFQIVCKAQKKDLGQIISWSIGNEESVSGFEIEKSVNNSGFKRIASLVPIQNKLSYDFSDNNVQDGNSLYRIKVVLNNGKIRYSNTVALVYNKKQLLITSITPNPAHTSANITISSPGNVSLKLSLYDMQGKVVRVWEQKFNDGTNVITLPLGDLLNGIYLLSGSDGNFKANVMRIVKQ